MPVPQNIRDAIAAELLAGASQGSLRKKYRVGAETVASIKAFVDGGGQTSPSVLSLPKADPHPAVTLAREVKASYSKLDREEGLAEFARHIRAQLPFQTRAGDIRQLMVAYAICIDKFRLEAGESSTIEELIIDDARADADPLEELRGRVIRLSERTRSG